MVGRLHGSRFSWLIVGCLLLLLVLLATLQYRWTGEVSRGESARLRAGLATSAHHIAADFNRELTRVFLSFHLDAAVPPSQLAGGLGSLLAHWQESAPYPQLVRDLWLLERTGGELRLQRFDAVAGRLELASPPPDVQPLLRRLDRREPPPGWPGGPGRMFLAPEVPAVMTPRAEVEGAGERRFEGPWPAFESFVVIRLDLDYLRSELLPLLARQHLASGGGLAYQVAVLDGASGAVLYASEPWPTPDGQQPVPGDLEVELFDFLGRDELRGLWFDLRLGAERRGGPVPRGPRGFWRSGPRTPAPQPGGGGWRLLLRHPAGSVEAAVDRARQRNLGVSFGVLLLIALTVGMLVASSRRAQRLAEQQLEFVAGISHELRTPLAAISSLGQNLADGVVREPEQVRRYGSLIHGQGVRLTRLVEQVLELAGILSGKPSYAVRETSLAAVAEAAVAASQPLLDEAGVTVELRLAQNLPAVMADPDAVQRAVQNLISNAVKYGADGWLAVEVAAEGADVCVRVVDRGAGIAREDLPHLFEPFYRSRRAREAQIPGSGLGLSLVRHVAEAHGGRVEVRSEPGRGSTFTLCLPVRAGEESVHVGQEDPAG